MKTYHSGKNPVYFPKHFICSSCAVEKSFPCRDRICCSCGKLSKLGIWVEKHQNNISCNGLGDVHDLGKGTVNNLCPPFWKHESKGVWVKWPDSETMLTVFTGSFGCSFDVCRDDNCYHMGEAPNTSSAKNLAMKIWKKLPAVDPDQIIDESKE